MSQPHDPRPGQDLTGEGATPTIDDDELATLVRASAASWTMPPVRLDEAGWRERTRTPRARRVAMLRGWTGLFGRALAASLALTVGAAVLGVYLTRPLGPASPSHSPRGTNTGVATPGPSHSGAAPSPLPKLLLQGDLPSPSQLIVNVDAEFALVDLASGTLGSRLASGDWGSTMRRATDGSIYCVCLTGDSTDRGGAAHVTVTWTRYVDGVVAGSALIGEYRGAPTEGDVGLVDQPSNVTIHVSFGPGADLAYVGWTVHAHPAWSSGMAIVDVNTGEVIQRLDLPDAPDGDDVSRTGMDAPRVIGTAGAGRVLIARPWYRWSPPSSLNPTYHFGSDVFVATTNDGHLSGVESLPVAAQCGDQVAVSGTVASGNWWLGCVAGEFSRSVVRRITPDDHVIGDVQVSTPIDVGDERGTSALSPDGAALYLWNPYSLVLTRVDLESGEISTGTGAVTAAVDGGPLAAFGRWLTPPALAKIILSSGIAVSPDGSRIYALGIGGPSGDEFGGSEGLFVFDTSTLGQVDHWAATADYVSIAVSSDGRFVYAAGSPGLGADGSQTNQPASITVFDTDDGSIHLIAGELGNGFMLFPSTVVR